MACSSSSNDSGTGTGGTSGNFRDGGLPDIDASKLVIAMSPTEKASICDWIANLVGGYGSAPTTQCDGGLQEGKLSAGSSQAVCVTGLSGYPSTCTMTVGAFEGWALSIVAHPCNYDPPADYKASSASCIF